MKYLPGSIAWLLAAVLCSLPAAEAEPAEPKSSGRVGRQPYSDACAETSPPLVFTKQDFQKGFDRLYMFPNVTYCDGYEAGVSDRWERSGSLRLRYDPAAPLPMTAEVRYRERWACDDGEAMADHSFEWSGSLQPVDKDPDGIFPAAGFEEGMVQPANFTNKDCENLGEGRPSPWVSVYLGLVYENDATGKLVREPYIDLDGGPSGVGHISFGPIPEEEEYDVEVAVTPEPRSDYETWRPRGNLDPSIPGNQLTLHVKVHEKDDPDVPRRASLRFAFRDVSRERGVCLNWPANGADTKPDLKLRFADESLGTPSADGTSIETSGLVQEVDLIIESYDFGAWGTLRISGTDKDKNPVTVKVMGKATPDLTIPLDDDGNRIADVWEPGTAGGKPADSDEEHQEGNSNDGDGLTLYEEYRGFIEAGKHGEGDPAKKDFFVQNLIGESAQPGIDLFGDVTQLAVHSRFDPNELDWTRVINRYSDSGSKQHGVVIMRNPDPAVAYSEAFGGPGPPGKVSPILISAATAIDKREVAHELLHACNVWHHGDDDEEVIWAKDGLRNDQINEYLDRCNRTKPVKAFDRDGSRIEPSDLHPDGSNVRISLQHGEHSGAEDCLMRYAYRGNLARLDAASPKTVRRMAAAGQTGIAICRSPGGTGINATNLGWGDAADGRGDCFGQIHVNDRIPPQDRMIMPKPCAQDPP